MRLDLVRSMRSRQFADDQGLQLATLTRIRDHAQAALTALEGAPKRETREERLAAESLHNYAGVLIDAVSNNDIEPDQWVNVIAKTKRMLKDLDAAKKQKPAVEDTPEMTPDMYAERRRQLVRAFRLCSKEHAPRLVRIPILLVYPQAVSMVPFKKHGVPAFYYGDRETYSGMYVVLPNQPVVVGSSKALPKNYASVGQVLTPEGMVRWVIAKDAEDAFYSAMAQGGVTMPTWSVPWS